MSIRVGFDHYTISHRGLTPEEILEFARTHGMDGVQFLEPSVIDAGLDPERLAGFRRAPMRWGFTSRSACLLPIPCADRASRVNRCRPATSPGDSVQASKGLRRSVAGMRGCTWVIGTIGFALTYPGRPRSRRPWRS